MRVTRRTLITKQPMTPKVTDKPVSTAAPQDSSTASRISSAAPHTAEEPPENQPAWAVVTGGSSGIGREFARALAARGQRVLITGRRPEQLAQTAAEIEAETGMQIATHIVELSDPAERRQFLDRVDECRPLETVVANAGFGFSEPFLDAPVSLAQQMVAVHVTSVVELFHRALPIMMERRHGALIAVGSLASLLPVPGAEVYVATKSFLNSFCESLRISVAERGVRVQLLLPGFTHTDFHRYDSEFVTRVQQSTPASWMSAADVVGASMRALDANRLVCIPGFSNRLLATAHRLLPRWLVRAATSRMYRKQQRR